jgi:hypothetical protein
MLDDARSFLAAHGRVLDRRRFDCHFDGGPPEAVRDAVAAYRNADGGFGHALEPDCRAPGSQPAATAMALETLHETGAWDEDLARGACEWLQTIEPEEGGAPFVLPSVEGWPAAPWWQPEPGLPASLTATGLLAGPLLARGVEHPWLTRAVDWLWRTASSAEGEYPLRGVLAFLEHVPDRERALAVLRGLDVGDLGPLDVAPTPESPGRALVGDVGPALDALAAGQEPDGGWTFEWPAWSPVAAAEWRGSLTVYALITLSREGRLVTAGEAAATG